MYIEPAILRQFGSLIQCTLYMHVQHAQSSHTHAPLPPGPGEGAGTQQAAAAEHRERAGGGEELPGQPAPQDHGEQPCHTQQPVTMHPSLSLPHSLYTISHFSVFFSLICLSDCYQFNLRVRIIILFYHMWIITIYQVCIKHCV